MNYLDIIIIIPVLWSIYKGFTKGFVIEVASVGALLLGIYGSIKFSGFASSFISDNTDLSESYVPIVSFAVTFLVIVIGVKLLANLIDKLVKAVALGFFNRIGGAAFGVVKSVLILSVVLVILNHIDEKVSFIPKHVKEDSLLFEPVLNAAPTIFPIIKDVELI